MFLTYRDKDPVRAAKTLNAWTDEFIAVAMLLKKKNIASVAAILEGQREFAAGALSQAESQLQGFRVATATKPSEQQVMVPGIEMTTNPVFSAYFRDRILVDSYRRDREALEAILSRGRETGDITREAVLSVPVINGDPAAENIRRLLIETEERQLALRKLRETYTDETRQVKEAQAALTTVRTVSIPGALDLYIEQLRIRERALDAQVAQTGKDLKEIPERTIEEQRLKRSLEVADALYKSLNLKAAEAKLAEASTVPDVSVLDPAVAPLSPTRNTAPVLIFGATAVAVLLGALLAVFLDQVDRRFRYPEQATDDLGLFILGVVPNVSTKRRARDDEAAQVVEAFRTIRMNVRYAADPSKPLTVTVTSPGPNDGKSLISSNLALSFAEAGARTLLIDGDIRRGELAKTFNVTSRPGLVEYLDGTALIAEVLHPVATHPNLTLMPAGARRRRAPELLATPRLSQLISQMALEYDVLIVDSPPLGAGFDAYALATATGNMALVLRTGMTDRKMAAAKMAIVETLPVRVMGAILNGITLEGVYQYYSYYQDYASRDEEPTGRLTSGGGSGATVTAEIG